MNQVKTILIYTLLHTTLSITNVYSQLDINDYEKVVSVDSTDDTLLLYECKHYFDPLYNAILKNIGFSSCWDKDEISYCFLVQEKSINNDSKIIKYYNRDTIMTAFGYIINGKPHGIFKIYCPSFPYCEMNEIQNSSIADIVYFKGKILAEIIYDNDKILVRKKSRLFSRKTRTVIIGEVSDRKAQKFFRKNENLVQKIKK